MQERESKDEDYIVEAGERSYKPSKKYIKITNDVKKHLLENTIQKHMSIKQVSLYLFQAAEQQDMNYTSAKHILSEHRKSIKAVPGKTKKIRKGFNIASYEDKETHYAQSQGADLQKVILICSTGGKMME